MASTTSNTRHEENIDNQEPKRHTVSMIGCGKIGVLHACLFADAGFKIVCADIDQNTMNLLAKGKAPFQKREVEAKLKDYVKTGTITIANDIKTAVSTSNVIVVAIPVTIDEKRNADYSAIEKTCKQIGSNFHRDSLIIVISVTGIGVTEGLIKETLENTSGFKAGVDFGLAYSPIQTCNAHTLDTLANTQRIVAAIDKNSLNVASTILEKITKNGLKKTNKIKTAEAATLFGLAQQDASVALANELALFCEKIGLDYFEAYKLLNVDIQDMLSLPMLENEDSKDEMLLLLGDAENLNVKLRIAANAKEINAEIVKHALNLTKDALKTCGKTMRRARISLLGISQTRNAKSPAKKIANELSEMLEARGAKVSFYDPYCSSSEEADMQCPSKKNLTEVVEGADCLLIVTGHEQFTHLNFNKLKVVMKMPAAIVDFEGIIEPEKVEKEGLVYRGLGRGTWTK